MTMSLSLQASHYKQVALQWWKAVWYIEGCITTVEGFVIVVAVSPQVMVDDSVFWLVTINGLCESGGRLCDILKAVQEWL
jgi:membrane-anchored glycerophosphoryl diester phosphodiesterase (GDPDase)